MRSHARLALFEGCSELFEQLSLPPPKSAPDRTTQTTTSQALG